MTTNITTKLRQRLFTLGRTAYHTPLPEILFLSSFVLARYLNNSDFSYPSELALPLIMFGFLSTAVFYVYRLVLKRQAGAHLASLVTLYSYYNFAGRFPKTQRVIESLLPNSWETPFTKALIMMLVLAVFGGLLGWVLIRLINHFKILRRPELVKIFMFGLAFIFAWQLVRTGLRVFELRRELSYKPPAVNIMPTKPVADNKPNVYYLVFDRYANNQTLKDIYGYDNSKTTNFLQDLGFVVRPEAYSNYPFTLQSVSSTLAMDYLGDYKKFDRGNYQAAFPLRKVLENPPVVQILRQNGYQYNQISSWWDFTRIRIRANGNPTKSFRLRLFGLRFWQSDLERDILNKSIFSPLLKKGLTVGRRTIAKYDLDNNPVQNFEQQQTALKQLANGTLPGIDPSKPQFNFAHILAPHDPYVFEADGSTPSYSGERTDDGLDEYQKYTRQLDYINGRLRDVVGEIRRSDPSAAIIIQADEGPYPKEFRGELTASHNYEPVNLKVPQMKQKFGILAAYYLPGVNPAIVSQNVNASVNPFRFMLNQYLGYNLPMLPDCHFSTGNKFRLYNFVAVNKQLTGRQPEECDKFIN